MKKLHIFIIVLFIVSIYSCRSNKEERITKGEEYFPIKIGDKKLYSIDTVIFDLFKKRIDTFSNIVQEEVVEKFVDLSGDTVYRIELSVYRPDKFAFVAFKSFERKIKDNYAMEKMENNQEVKMLFPIAAYKTKGTSYTWNANMFNSRAPAILKFSSVFTPYKVGTTTYNDCVSVKYSKPKSGIENDIREEVYAKNIGLIYKFTDSTDLLQNDTFLSGKRIFIKLLN